MKKATDARILGVGCEGLVEWMDGSKLKGLDSPVAWIQIMLLECALLIDYH